MVISQEIIERLTGNRGTKTIAACLHTHSQRKSAIVKAQRVDVSQRMNIRLRCTLKSFERNLVTRILPKQIIKRNLTTLNNNNSLILNPWFVTGFTDAEGCFTVVLQKNPKAKFGYSISARFKICLHKKDLAILEGLKAFFGVGNIQATGKNRDSFEFIVKSIKDLTAVIIPHYDSYPLITQKKADYELFKLVISLINNKEHLSSLGLLRIVNLKASINKGLSDALKVEFPLNEPYPRPLVDDLAIPHPQWVAGFTSGDGSFYILIRRTKDNFRVVLRFVISQHKRDKQLITKFIDYFNCGRLVKYDDMVDFCIENNGDNLEKILPFFNENQILGVKAKDFED